MGFPNITGCWMQTVHHVPHSSHCFTTSHWGQCTETHTHTHTRSHLNSIENISTQRMSWLVFCGVSVLFRVLLYFTYFRGFSLCCLFCSLTLWPTSDLPEFHVNNVELDLHYVFTIEMHFKLYSNLNKHLNKNSFHFPKVGWSARALNLHSI